MSGRTWLFLCRGGYAPGVFAVVGLLERGGGDRQVGYGGGKEGWAAQARVADGDKAQGDFRADFGGAVAGGVQVCDGVWAFGKAGERADGLEGGRGGRGGAARHAGRGGLEADGLAVGRGGCEGEDKRIASMGGGEGDGRQERRADEGQDGFTEKGQPGRYAGMVDGGKGVGGGYFVSSRAVLGGVHGVGGLLPLAFVGHRKGLVHLGQPGEVLPRLGGSRADGGASLCRCGGGVCEGA